MPKTKKTIVTFVLDESGSMEFIKDDTIGGFNSYIDTLKNQKGDIRFSLVKFDSNRVDKVYVGVPIKDVVPLNGQTYTPGAATPLIDACVKAIKATEKKAGKNENVAIVIQTDGYENASSEHNRDDLVALVKEKTDAGWLFTFIGAGIDAFAAAGQFGIAAANTMSYGLAETQSAFASTARATAAFHATGSATSAAYTEDERKAAAGNAGSASNRANANRANAARRVSEKQRRSGDGAGQSPKPIVENFSL